MTVMQRPRVLLADDHVMVAQGLSRLLEGEVDIVATVSDGAELVAQAQKHRPDIIVADMSMPVMNGLEAMRRLKTLGIRAKFIFVTLHAEPRLASEAMRNGASGYVLKQAAGDELIEAVRAVAGGLTYLTPLITRDVLRAMAQPDDAEQVSLTARQLDVLRLIAEGRRMKEIASELQISVRTVETHKQSLLHSLGAETTADLIKFAIKHGLIPG
jgi:DNA-binding NarL/FixJ family response regulator